MAEPPIISSHHPPTTRNELVLFLFAFNPARYHEEERYLRAVLASSVNNDKHKTRDENEDKDNGKDKDKDKDALAQYRRWKLNHLAQVCLRANALLQSYQKNANHEQQDKARGGDGDGDGDQYLWFRGGDGPVFAVHVHHEDEHMPEKHDTTFKSRGVPYLRASCYYGDESEDVRYCMKLMSRLTHDLTLLSLEENNIRHKDSLGKLWVAWQAWDAALQCNVALVEAAEHLPDWMTYSSRTHLNDFDESQDQDQDQQEGEDERDVNDNRIWFVSKQGQYDCAYAQDHNAESSKRDGPHVILVAPKETPNSHSRYLTKAEALLIMWQYFKHEQNQLHQSNYNAKPPNQNQVQWASKPMLQALHPFLATDCNSARFVSFPKQHHHCTAVVVPLRVAQLFETRPDLVHPAVESFCQVAQCIMLHRHAWTKWKQDKTSTDNKTPPPPPPKVPPVGKHVPYQELVFFVVRCSRLRYAMLRHYDFYHHKDKQKIGSTTQKQSRWKPPKVYTENIEYIRMKKKCEQHTLDDENDNDNDNSRTKVLEHAMDNGVRLTLGLEWFLFCERQQEQSHEKQKSSKIQGYEMGEVEQRVRLYWRHMEAAMGGHVDDQKDDCNEEEEEEHWIEQAWRAGPSHHDSSRHGGGGGGGITVMAQCPTLQELLQRGHGEYHPKLPLCAMRYPHISIEEQIRRVWVEAARGACRDSSVGKGCGVPLREDVDEETWLYQDPTTRIAAKASRDGVEAVPCAGGVRTSLQLQSHAQSQSLPMDQKHSQATPAPSRIVISHACDETQNSSNASEHGTISHQTPPITARTTQKNKKETNPDGSLEYDIGPQEMEEALFFPSQKSSAGISKNQSKRHKGHGGKRKMKDIMRAMDADLEGTAVRQVTANPFDIFNDDTATWPQHDGQEQDQEDSQSDEESLSQDFTESSEKEERVCGSWSQQKTPDLKIGPHKDQKQAFFGDEDECSEDGGDEEEAAVAIDTHKLRRLFQSMDVVNGNQESNANDDKKIFGAGGNMAQLFSDAGVVLPRT